MKNNTQHIDDLLVKLLTGEATEAEHHEVQQWLAENDTNRRYYDHFRLIWEESVHLAATTEVDENAAWTRFRQKTRQRAIDQPTARVWNMNHPLLRAAVIAAVVIGLAVITYYLTNNPGTVINMATIQATDAVKNDSLPDGSLVVLNKHSQLSYPTQFTGQKRVVQMNGEAFFQVTPNKKKPFIIHTNNVTITVVGTSFNVRSRGDTTEIIVETGVVTVAVDQQTVTLKAGEKVITYQKEARLEKQASNDQLHSYYRSKRFDCDNTPLWKLVEKLNEAYNVQIVVEPQVRNVPWTGVYNEGDPLNNILDILHETLDITVVRKKGQIILR